MGFVSQGKGFGTTFFFELPVYSAAFAGKECMDVSIGPTVPKDDGSDNPLDAQMQSGYLSIKPTVAKAHQRKVHTSSIHAHVSEVDGKDNDADKVEEYWPPIFDNALPQQSPSHSRDLAGLGNGSVFSNPTEKTPIAREDSRSEERRVGKECRL